MLKRNTNKLHKIMIIDRKREKLLQAIIYFAQNTNKLGKTKLLKLLYHLDFQHFQKYGVSVTGLRYHAWPMGPVQVHLFEQLDNLQSAPDLKDAIYLKPVTEQFTQIIAKKPFNEKRFSKNQLKLIQEIAFVFKEATAEQMVKSTHMPNDPWDVTYNKRGSKQQEIDYLLALDNPDSISREIAIERQSEVKGTISISS